MLSHAATSCLTGCYTRMQVHEARFEIPTREQLVRAVSTLGEVEADARAELAQCTAAVEAAEKEVRLVVHSCAYSSC